MKSSPNVSGSGGHNSMILEVVKYLISRIYTGLVVNYGISNTIVLEIP